MDGEIYDYDPDSDMERAQYYLADHPPAIRFAQNDHYFIEDKVIRCMNSLPQFKLTASILLQNLRLKSQDKRDSKRASIRKSSLAVDVSPVKEQTIQLGGLVQTESKSPMLGDEDSMSRSPRGEPAIAFDSNTALRNMAVNDSRNHSLGKVKINRVHPLNTFSLSARKDFFPDIINNSPLP